MPAYHSRRDERAKADPSKLTAHAAAEYLGVSVGWLRKNTEPSEWHHANFRYDTKAHYWDKVDLSEAIDALTDPADAIEYGLVLMNRKTDTAKWISVLRLARERKQKREEQ